ncbi:hypothetical protein EDD17DRAFT_1548617, partial [Pisolithus thermaeus]
VLAERWACIQCLSLIYLIMANFYGSETSLQQCAELLHHIFTLIDITHRKRSPRPKKQTILNGESKGGKFTLHE